MFMFHDFHFYEFMLFQVHRPTRGNLQFFKIKSFYCAIQFNVQLYLIVPSFQS